MRDRLLHLADLHLGDGHDYLGPSAPARRSEADLLLRRLVDFALAEENQIAAVAIAGDLFDHHHPPHALVESALADLARVVAAGLHLITVPGNHDEWSYADCVYRTYVNRWPGLLVTQPNPGPVASWRIGGAEIEVHALAYVAGRTRLPLDTSEIRPSGLRRILIAHGSLDVDWTDRSVPIRSAALIEAGYDYVALGHIHQAIERRIGDGWACYPGRIEGGGFDDPGVDGVLTVKLTEPALRPERRPFSHRPILDQRWNLSGHSDLGELRGRLHRFAEEQSGAIARIELAGLPDFDLEPTRLQEEVRGGFFHLELVDGRGGFGNASLETVAQETTIRGAFARRALRAIEETSDEEERALRRAAARFGLDAFERSQPVGDEA
ncbi:MAG: DNA repair exonuclease [Candidatus Eisenbacteria bacterium]|nr:DNA repair exonuclease [Candidatus Eisenbacteria bacterium]